MNYYNTCILSYVDLKKVLTQTIILFHDTNY